MTSTAQQATRWRLEGLLEHFRTVHKTMPDHAYAWVLGAGASKPSGIPLAGELVQRWLGELHRRLDDKKQPLATWATAENLGIDKFDYEQAASFYSRVYERRFGDNPDEGFACLEDLMGQRDPSPGYSILAQILDKTPHKVVISTNFDNLVADALSIYTSTFPLVIGHESLANFVKVVSRRPVICKIHRDLLLGPKSDTRSLRRLHESWAAALRALFSQYTPLFVGYGGNDDSLMDLLESLDPGDIKGQLIWCYYERSEPSPRIQELVAQHRGALVPVPDFDLLMVLFGSQLEIEPIDDTIEKRAAERAKRYRRQLIDLDTSSHPRARDVLKGAFARAGSLAWLKKAQTELSTDAREQVYRQALEHYPEDSQVKEELGNFLSSHGRDTPLARLLLAACKDHTGLALLDIRDGSFQTAEQELDKGDEQESLHQIARGFLLERQGNIDAAEAHFKTLTNEDDPVSLVALFKFYVRQGRPDESLTMMERVHLLYPDHIEITALLASQLWVSRDDLTRASPLFQDVMKSPDADGHDLLLAATFFLARGERENFDHTMATVATKPMQFWTEEAIFLFLRIVDAAISHEVELAKLLESMWKQLTYRYHKNVRITNMLMKLLEALKPNIPNPHRKFLPALAQAIGDPELLSGLTSFPQWHAAVEATSAKTAPKPVD